MTVWVIGISFLISILLNVPVAITLGITTVVTVLTFDLFPMSMVIQSYFSAGNSFPLMAVPFFVLAGYIMTSGGIANRLIDFSKGLVGNIPGGLGIVTVFTCMIFAAISGSGPATVAAIGGIMVPAMVKEGYNKSFSATLSAAGGSLGPVIPPSISFIIYGVVTGVSITDLFIAGIIPGMLLAFGLMLVVFFIYRKKKMNVDKEKRQSIKGFLTSLNYAKWALLAPIIILGGIYSGIFTPTEAAIITCVYSLIIGIFVHKELRLSGLPQVFSKTTITCGSILILVGSATTFARLLTIERIPQKVADSILGISSNEIIILLMIILFILLIGTVIETLAAIIIVSPLLLPVAEQIGVTPLHLGVILVIGLSIGMCTPPVGVNLFVASGIAKIKVEKMVVWLIPLVGVMITVLILIAFVPAFSTFLPDLLRN